MAQEILQVIWFMLVAVLILGFAILSGFDLGVGSLHLFTKNKKERANNFYAIGPFWDSNQVWLLTGGGALFAAFPMVYATAFSAFYLALMLLLLFLIIRIASIEFEHQISSPSWKSFWDWGFGIGSIVPAVLFGVAIGNVMRGIPLDANYNFTGSFFGLLNPYSIVIGLLSLAMFMMHGAAFMIARMQGDIIRKAKVWGYNAWAAFILLYVIATVWSYFSVPLLFNNFYNYPVLIVLPMLAVTAMFYYPSALKSKNGHWSAFITSTLNIVGILGTLAASLFPYLIPSSTDLANSLTIYNSSSSQLTLTVMLILAVIGVPLVVLYTAYVYRKFKGNTSQAIADKEYAKIIG